MVQGFFLGWGFLGLGFWVLGVLFGDKPLITYLLEK